NARTRVHEYGGGDYTVADGVVYFSNFADQRLYKQTPNSQPEAITPATEMRYADMIIDGERGRIITVREDHTGAGEAVNALVGINLEDGENARVLVSGNDFYSSPRLSPNGKHLAWLTWNHPNMPWDGTELWVGEINEDGTLTNMNQIAGGVEESIFQPEWSPDGTLYFVSDRSGWWNLYRRNDDGSIEALSEMQAEFGMPQWVFGMSMYAFESEERIICAYIEKGSSRLASLDTRARKFETINTPYTDITSLHASRGRAIFRGGSPREPAAIVQMDLSNGKTETLRRSIDLEID